MPLNVAKDFLVQQIKCQKGLTMIPDKTLIEYLRQKGWTEKEIVQLIEYITQ